MREEISCSRAEWIRTCQEANERIAEEKESARIEYLDDLELDPNPAKVWSLIRNLPHSPPPNEALPHNYAKVSSLKMSNIDRKKKKELLKQIECNGPDEEISKGS